MNSEYFSLSLEEFILSCITWTLRLLVTLSLKRKRVCQTECVLTRSFVSWSSSINMGDDRHNDNAKQHGPFSLYILAIIARIIIIPHGTPQRTDSTCNMVFHPFYVEYTLEDQHQHEIIEKESNFLSCDTFLLWDAQLYVAGIIIFWY